MGVAILTGLWQGTLIGAITAAALLALRGRSARARHHVACFALAAMLLAFVGTFGLAFHNANGGHANGLGGLSVAASPGRAGPVRSPALTSKDSRPVLDLWPAFSANWEQKVKTALPFGQAWLAIGWLIGTAAFSISNVVQFAAVRRLTAGARFDINDNWREAFETMSRELRLNQLVRLGHSVAVEVPTVIGWFAPVVLVPFGPCTTLSKDEMRAILAHEFAHIRRRDYLVNIVQKVVEAVLFFHPVTWWLSRRIRLEREYCCDDAAVTYTSSALAYARALAQLETLRTRPRGYAMGADGGSLMNRITRIVGTQPQRRRVSIAGGVFGTLAVAMAGMIFLAAGSAHADSPGATPENTEQSATATTIVTDGAPPEIVAAIQTALEQLVTDGTISQAQADAIGQDVAAGGVDESALVEGGFVTDAQMQAVSDVMREVKMSFDPGVSKGSAIGPGGKTVSPATCDGIAASLDSAVSAGKVTSQEADKKLEGCDKGGQPDNLTCDDIAAQLAQAVAEGSVSQDQASQKVAGCSDGHLHQASCEDIATYLNHAVEAGEITRAQADLKLANCPAEAKGS